MIETEIITNEDLKRYLGLLDNMEILGMKSDRYTCFGAFDRITKKGMGVLVDEENLKNAKAAIDEAKKAFQL